MTKGLALLATCAASAVLAGSAIAGDIAVRTPATMPAAPPADQGGMGLRAAARTPHPLDAAPIAPDPVRFGGFVEKPKPPSQSFLGEGTFVFERPALFSLDPEGQAIVRFDPDSKAGKDAKPSQPVYVLPNLKRMAIEDAIKGRALPLIVSGTATEFEGHNYLLLDDGTRPAGPPTTAPAPSRPAVAAKDQTADQMLGQLLRSAPGSATLRPAPIRWDQPLGADKTSGNGAVKPGAPGVALIREGRYLPDRIGRLTRSPDGKTAELTFDSDGKALRDPPIILMPCAKLSQMEATATSAGVDVRFRVSGSVTEYRGRNYLMLEKAVNVYGTTTPF